MPLLTVDSVVVRQRGDRLVGTDGTSSWIWFAARQLEEHLLLVCFADHATNLSDCRILELGSGTGWLSLRLAIRGATVTATDQLGAIPLLSQNICFNQALFMDQDGLDLDVNVQTLGWNTQNDRIPGEWDLFIGSDLHYLNENYRPLLETCIRHGCRRCIFAWEQRIPEEEDQFKVIARDLGFILDYLIDTGKNPSTLNSIWIGNWKFVPPL